MSEIPLAYECDVIVAGGALRAVKAALVAARAGCSVLLAAPRPYLGDDMCATLRLWLEEGKEPAGPLTERIFADGSPARPMRVKKVLDQALLDAGVRFLFGCYATEVLRDENDRLAGVVLANRAGRQAVAAPVLLDATDRAVVARACGVPHRRWPAGKHLFRRVIVAESSDNPTRQVPLGEPETSLSYFEHEVELSVAGGDFSSLSAAEQIAREKTYQPGQLRASEKLFFVPPDPIIGEGAAAEWTELSSARIGHFRPEGIEGLYVLGPRADVPRDAAEELMRPAAGEVAGRLVGEAAAVAAGQRRVVRPVRVDAAHTESAPEGTVHELRRGLRPAGENAGTVPDTSSNPPVLGQYDVVVVGGGTSGACAAIGAGRRGARVLVVEYQEGLGGTGTLGMIGSPYHGRNAGFSREVPFPHEDFNLEDKMEWFRREIRETGGDIWLGALACGALTEGARVTGVVVATPEGRGVVSADVVIDSTGSADVAAAAGAQCSFGDDPRDIALQGAGLPVRPLRASSVNSDYLLVDESDIVDTTRTHAGARMPVEDAEYDMGPLIQTRERRRVVGDHVLSYLDQIADRTYSDSVVLSESDYDAHGYSSLACFAMLPHDEASRKENHPAPGGPCYTPYRCLLPRGLEGILVTGLGTSMHRDACALIRMQRDLHNQGYAAGVAAAMASQRGCGTREIQVRALQQHLVEVGSLPPEVLDHEDSFPLPQQEIEQAVEELGRATNPREAGRPLGIVLSHADLALPSLRDAFDHGSGDERILYAKVLGFLGISDVIPVLTEALDRVEEWDAKILQGRMAEYAHLPTPTDGLIMALGWTGEGAALRPVLDKLEMLDAGVTLSHHRAVALALERIADPSAAPPLARLLEEPGMRGHVMPELEPLHDKPAELRRRTGPLREITLARALYRCGDHEGLGETILREYRDDVRGLFARHADAVLEVARD